QLCVFCFSCACYPPHLHSFPTRRSSDLTTTSANVNITSVNYYILPYQSVSGLVLSLYNNAGTIIATSSTNTTLSAGASAITITRSEEHTSELQSRENLVCRLLLEKKKNT